MEMALTLSDEVITSDGESESRRATLPCFGSQAAEPRRRSSLFDRTVRAHYENRQPTALFGCWPFDSIVQSVYWALRSVQFWLCYRYEELEYDYFDFSIPVISTKPPSLNELASRTQFDKTWLKYIYAKFKEECPSGLMRLEDFQKIFSQYLPHRAGDAFIERLFNAFARNGSGSESEECITFEAFVETLHLINQKTAETNAEWAFRIMDANDRGTIDFHEFVEFVRSVFELVGREKPLDPSLRPLARVVSVASFEIQLSPGEIRDRASKAFSVLDSDKSGILALPDLINFFQNERHLMPSEMQKSRFK